MGGSERQSVRNGQSQLIDLGQIDSLAIDFSTWHILGLSQPLLALPRMLIGEECIIFSGFNPNCPPTRGPVIICSGSGSRLPPPRLTQCLCHSCFAHPPCFVLWVGSCQSRFDLISSIFLAIGISEPYMRKFPGRLNLLFLFLITAWVVLCSIFLLIQPFGLVAYAVVALT